MANSEPQNQTGQNGQPSAKNPPPKNPPIERFYDGAVNAKVWRNINKDGNPYYNVRFSKIYTDPQTGQPAETQSFSGSDILKVQRLAAQSYHAIDRMKKLDRDQARQNTPQQEPMRDGNPDQNHNLAQQRDNVMHNAAPDQQTGGQGQQQHNYQPQHNGPNHEQ